MNNSPKLKNRTRKIEQYSNDHNAPPFNSNIFLIYERSYNMVCSMFERKLR